MASDPVYGNFIEANTIGQNSNLEATVEDATAFANAITGIDTTPQPQGYNARQQGVFGLNPLATPKYAKNKGIRDAEFKDTLARLYIALPTTGNPSQDRAIRDAYIESLPSDTATRELAKVLINTGTGSGFIDFFLSQAQESFQEVMQLDKVLADDYVAFFYGQTPPVFQYTGMLLNSMQDDQRTGFARAYNALLRGTQLARRGALARLRYDSVIVSGVLIATSQTLTADNEMAVPFQFSFLVKEYVLVGNDIRFDKLNANQYVELAAQTEVAKLSSAVGSITDTRIRAAIITTPVPAAVSIAGAEEPKSVVDSSKGPFERMVDSVEESGVTGLAQPAVKGVVQNPVASPPVSTRQHLR